MLIEIIPAANVRGGGVLCRLDMVDDATATTCCRKTKRLRRGVKHSGYGGELSDLGIKEFVNQKLVLVAKEWQAVSRDGPAWKPVLG
jgi:hypothetical protein